MPLAGAQISLVDKETKKKFAFKLTQEAAPAQEIYLEV